jgi:uncharacterized protein YndB with AHSA1/START domain
VTEILIDVDFGHPPERVWRALTDRAVLSEWFMRTDLEPYEGRRFSLTPDGLLGLAGPIEGELVEVAAPRRLVMLWRGEQMHSRVTWELVPLPLGCRLRMSHTGFIGVKGGLRRKELRRMYDRMLAERLPRALDRLATGRIATQDPAPSPAGPPPVPLLAVPPLPDEPAPDPDAGVDADDASRRTGIVGWLRALPHRRRGLLLAAGVAVLLAVITAALINGLSVPSLIPPLGATPGDWPTVSPGPAGRPLPPVAASPRASGAPVGGPSSGSPVPGRPGQPVPVTPGGAPPPAGGGAPNPPAPPPAGGGWAAAYRTVRSTGTGFIGELTVTNTGSVADRGWTVVITLPAGAGVGTVRGAKASQNGSTVTFTAKKNGKIPAGRSVTIEFQVRGDGATAPTACRIGGDACDGLPG